MSRMVCLFGAVLALISFVCGQNKNPPRLQSRPPAPDNSGKITLDVQVTDRSGAPVRGLRQQDFTVLDDKQPQNIVSFQAVDRQAANDPAVEVILVVDAVNSSFLNVAYQRDAIRKFLLQNGGQLPQPVSLIVFTNSGTKMQNVASRDGKALSAAYDEYETGLRGQIRAQGFYGGAERLVNSLKALNSFAAYEENRPGRKLMIWFSPGWPVLSGPSMALSRQDEEQIFDSIVAFSRELRRARITLYDVDPRGVVNADAVRPYLYEQFLKGVSAPSGALPGDLSLQVLAVQSGGRVLNESNDLTSELAACAADAGAYYIISFNALPADQANEYHTISVKVDKPGAMARTRTGYYAQP